MSERAPRAASAPDGAALETLRELAVRCATAAGLLLRERFHTDAAGEVASKSTPTDLVSEADRAAERVIHELLAQARPRDGFLGEEQPEEQLGSSGVRWVVDPLDGTVNYLFGIPQWCVSVAAEDRLGALVGAIYDPLRGELFTVARGAPATLQVVAAPAAAGQLPRILSTEILGAAPRTLGGARGETLATAMVASGLAYDARVRAAQAEVLARLMPRVRDIRRFGSAALDLAWTAAGRYDAYFERSVKPWDIAAGRLLCEAVGLRVAELPARGILPWGVLVATPALCEPLLELVA